MGDHSRLRGVAIIGAGGFGREVLDILEAINQNRMEFNILGFLVESGFGTEGTDVNGKPILGDLAWIKNHSRAVEFVCAIGSPQVRRRVVGEATEKGARFLNVIHPSVRLTRWVRLGVGVVITAGCTLTNHIRIADHVQLNLHCTVGHDAVLEAYSTLAPGVHVSGGVLISEGAYVGTGANIIERINIGPWSTVGAGSTVVRDVPANSTAVGVPAKVIKTRPSGWHLE